MRGMLKRSFFEKPTLHVATKLLGKYLVRYYHGKTIARMIIEVEAYDGPCDKASHASKGFTPRTKVMFGLAGHWYIYFTYGMHWLANIVCGKKGYPAAVLIRGVEGVSGPARVAKFFKIDGKLNGKSANRETGLWVEDRVVKIKTSDVKRTPRIGVGYAGKVWGKKPYRFLYIPKNKKRRSNE